MYKTRFSNLRNLKKEEWEYILQEIERREEIGKPSQPLHHGRPIAPEKVDRAARRSRGFHPYRRTYSKHVFCKAAN